MLSPLHLTMECICFIFGFMRPAKIPVGAFLAMFLAGCAAVLPGPDFSPAYRGKTPYFSPEQKTVVQTAVSLLGTPYRYGGETPRGFDCSGFVKYVYQESVGIILPRHSRDQARAGRPVHASRLAPADVIYFKLRGQKAFHVGMYIGDGRFIHAPSSGGEVSIQELETEYWMRGYRGARRIL